MMGVPKKMPRIGGGGEIGSYERGVQALRTNRTYDMTAPLRAPLPYIGGKSVMAPEIWRRLGDTSNYVEPFCGSAAVLLARPHDYSERTETVNDSDGLLVNAYRAIQFDPERTAHWCDWPVSEADLTSRHLHLKAAREELTARLMADPFHFDPILGAFWLWGAASWIGDGWCVADGPWVAIDGKLVDRRTLPPEAQEQDGVRKKMPQIGSSENCGDTAMRGIQVYRGVPKQMPVLDNERAMQGLCVTPTALLDYFARLSARLRRVRILCGDWKRAVKDSVTVNHGLTSLFIDPPYPATEHSMAYHQEEAGDIWHEAAHWAISKGNDPRLRICIAGYHTAEIDALFPASWQRVRWEARGGYANQSADGRGRANAKRECLWFSPACIDPANDYAGTLFEGL